MPDNKVRAITDLLVDNITTDPPEERSIHGIDKSRNKFVTRKNDKWSRDHHAEMLIRDFIRVLHKSCHEYANNNMKKMSNDKVLKTIAFMDSIRTVAVQHKVARNLYDKVQLDQISYMKNLEVLKAKYN